MNALTLAGVGAILVYRRTEQGFVREDYEGLTAASPLSEIETELPLAEIYQRVEVQRGAGVGKWGRRINTK